KKMLDFWSEQKRSIRSPFYWKGKSFYISLEPEKKTNDLGIYLEVTDCEELLKEIPFQRALKASYSITLSHRHKLDTFFGPSFSDEDAYTTYLHPVRLETGAKKFRVGSFLSKSIMECMAYTSYEGGSISIIFKLEETFYPK
ncbi:MAG TPA: hypothetical protein VHA52_03845, partial [Candidatus Babeliaceae bacterium]|nr:hypothetical protein [Candidatus Babeliaceae bacterium]